MTSKRVWILVVAVSAGCTKAAPPVTIDAGAPPATAALDASLPIALPRVAHVPPEIDACGVSATLRLGATDAQATSATLRTVTVTSAETMERAMDSVLRAYRKRPRRATPDGPPTNDHAGPLCVVFEAPGSTPLVALRALVGPQAGSYSQWNDRVEIAALDADGREVRVPLALSLAANGDVVLPERATMQELVDAVAARSAKRPRVALVP